MSDIDNPNIEPDAITRLPDKWLDEADKHTRDGYPGIAEGLRVAAEQLTQAIRAQSLCPECGGRDGIHGLVHVRYGNGGGGNRQCSRTARLRKKRS